VSIDRRARAYHVVSAFLVATGIVMLLAVAAIALRAWIAWPAHTWSAWSTGALVALCALAVLLWIAGAFFARRVHRERRDTVRTFLAREERDRVAGAIREFEAKTSGEIRVHLAERTPGDPVGAASRVFDRIGMARTRDRNGVLFFVSIRDRRFAVIGDRGIDAKVPADFWAGVVRAVESAFANGRYAEGLIEGITMAGARLTEHFPPRADDVNELPDAFSTESPGESPEDADPRP
jgi:uncharacterized membrane protein